jgi:predicted O-methyltransferase YrrM
MRTIKKTKESDELTAKVAAAINNETFHLEYSILYDIAQTYPANRHLVYLEIGCYAGGSACLMLQRPNTSVISIDVGGPVPRERVLDNVEKLNEHRNDYIYITGDSHDAQTERVLNEILRGTKVDILFIDGDHSAAGVRADFSMYSKHLADDGFIVFDDYGDALYSPEVKPGVDGINFKGYDVQGQLGNEYIVRKKQSKAAIFTLLYNDYSVIDESLAQLKKTATLDLPIYAVDNAYPFLTEKMVDKLKKKYVLNIINARHNRGLAGGYNELVNEVDADYAILFDCDSYPDTHGWDEAMMTVIKDEQMAYACLMFDIARNEMIDRGFTPWQCGPHVVWRPHSACVQSISCADLSYLREIGGLQEPKKYYGGLEGHMFHYWDDRHQIGYIDGYYETQRRGDSVINPLYTEYKWKYAHEGYDGSFDEFLKTKQ